MSDFSIELNKVKIQNIVTHKDTEFEFKPGISVVRGNNGAGKSVCFSTLGNLLYAQAPLSNKRNSAKLMHRKGGRIDLFLKSKDNDYQLSQYQKGTSVGYQIFKNGKNIETHTIATAQDQINKVFPLSQDQFYSTLYLTSYRSASHVLLNGTGPQRKEFFENFFNLQHYEIIYDILRQRYSDFKVQITKIDEKEEEITRLTSELHKVDEDKVKKLSAKLEKLQNKYNEYSSLIIKIDNYNQIKDKIIHKGSLKELIAEYKDVKKEIKKLRKVIEKDNKAEENNKHYEEINAKRKKLEDELKSLQHFDIDKLENEFQELDEKCDKIKDTIKQLESDKEDYEHYKKLSSKIPDKFKDSKDSAYSLIEKIKDKLGNARSISKKLGKLQGIKECPTCGSHLDKKEISYLYNKAKEDIKKFEKYEDIFDIIKEYYSYADITYDSETHKKLEKKLNKLNEDKKSIYEKLNIASEYEKVKEKLDNLPVVEYIKRVNIKEIRNDLKNKESYMMELKEDIVNVKYLRDMKIDEYLKKSKQIRKFVADNKTVINDLSEKVGKYKAYLISNKTNNKRIQQLKDDIEKLEKVKSKIKIYEALINAYGPKGIKVTQINGLADLFCNQLNLYASLLFPDYIKFSSYVDTNNFNILAERDNGIADVNTLSGAQSRCFQLLCVLVLLSFIPKKYKADTLILDEMEAGLKDQWRVKFATEFLPQLLNIVPKIVVITPMTSKEFYIPDATEYEVVKEKGVSKIIKK